jgi:two-component system, sporulation sensor kinase E
MLNINILPKLIKRLERIPQTNLKESLEQVREEEKLLLSTLDNLPVAAILLEGDKCLFINQYALNFFEISSSANFDLPLTDLIKDEGVKSWVKNEVLGRPGGYSNQSANVGSKKLIVSIEGGKRKLKQFTFLDVTKNIELVEEEFRSSKIDTISDLTRSVAHEIKNPLHSMQLHLRLLQEELKRLEGSSVEIKDQLMKTIAVVAEEAKRLDDLTNTFLKIDPSRERIYTDVTVQSLLENIIQFLKPEFDENGISLLTAFDERVSQIKAQKDRLKQAFLNIIKNAIEALGKNGGKILITTAIKGNACMVGIRDDGPGIPDAAQDKVFDMYYSTKAEGNGLGLALAREVIEEHGGKLQLESTEGKGAEFTVFLPIKQEPLKLSK